MSDVHTGSLAPASLTHQGHSRQPTGRDRSLLQITTSFSARPAFFSSNSYRVRLGDINPGRDMRCDFWLQYFRSGHYLGVTVVATRSGVG
jgi:hypothetical protein